jgi:hypothetical protein
MAREVEVRPRAFESAEGLLGVVSVVGGEREVGGEEEGSAGVSSAGASPRRERGGWDGVSSSSGGGEGDVGRSRWRTAVALLDHRRAGEAGTGADEEEAAFVESSADEEAGEVDRVTTSPQVVVVVPPSAGPSTPAPPPPPLAPSLGIQPAPLFLLLWTVASSRTSVTSDTAERAREREDVG